MKLRAVAVMVTVILAASAASPAMATKAPTDPKLAPALLRLDDMPEGWAATDFGDEDPGFRSWWADVEVVSVV